MFGLLKSNNTTVTTKILRWDSNSQPLDFESPPLTTKPGSPIDLWIVRTCRFLLALQRSDEPAEELEPAGGFVKRMDNILEQLKVIDADFSLSNVEKVRKSSEWLVRFALSVSKACPRDESDIFDACRNVVSELESLKTAHRHGTTLLRDALEGAEHAVNVSLLRLIVSTFSRSHLPLDLLIQEVVATGNAVSRNSQLPTEMDVLIQAVDDHNDDLFHAAYFSR